MILLYYSKTDNTSRFVKKLEIETQNIKDYSGVGDYVLLTPTYFFGGIPQEVDTFLKQYSSNMLGVISTGNKNWGDNYGLAGDKISEHYNVPLLYKFELSGNEEDVKKVDKIVSDMI